jgi:hypothetical protein
MNLVLVGLYRGIAAGMTGSFASGATYFGLIELSRSWINQRHPELASPISHFCAGALGIHAHTFFTYLAYV